MNRRTPGLIPRADPKSLEAVRLRQYVGVIVLMSLSHRRAESAASVGRCCSEDQHRKQLVNVGFAASTGTFFHQSGAFQKRRVSSKMRFGLERCRCAPFAPPE